MKQLLCIGLMACAFSSYGQGIKKYDIGDSGCSLYMYCDPGNFVLDYSDDSSKVYTAECTQDEITYGVICVKLKNSVSDLDAAEEVLISYLDFLKKNFEITSAAGYGKGHRLKDRDDTRGVIDYWSDKEKNDWKVKGWTDGHFLAVLYVMGKKEVNENKRNIFLDGFRLPED